MDDWLDSRLAEDHYLPDAGFTSRVMQRLPVAPALGDRRRSLLLAPFVVMAIAIFGVESLKTLLGSRAEILTFGSQLRPVLLHSASYLNVFSMLAYFLEQPAVLFGCLGVTALAAYLGSPSLRRWL